MERKGTRSIVLVSSPQNSKDKSLPQTDLLADPIFKRIIRQFDSALNLEPNQSLSEENQFASVVMSVASHSAYVHGLRERVHPGQIYPQETKFRIRFMGHSVGEMASLIEAGVADIDTIAWILSERQRITEQPLAGVIRCMFAVVGVDIKKLEKDHIQPIKKAFGDTVQIALANKNTPSQGVVSATIKEGDPRSLAKSFSQIFRDFQHPDSERPPRFIHLAEIKNAFHTWMLKPEQIVLQRTIAERYSRKDFIVPAERVIYSPMLGRWIRSDKDVWKLINNQLTTGVGFSDSIVRVIHDENDPIFVSADVREEVTPQMLRDNTDGKVPLLNIQNLESLNQAWDRTEELLAA